MAEPKRYFMMRRFLEQQPTTGPDGNARLRVRIELECGCEVEREVDVSRLIETESPIGEKSTLVPGKFVCGRHSFED